MADVMTIVDELRLVIETSLPSETDEKFKERLEEATDLVNQLETLIEHLFGEGGQFWQKGYALKIERW